jgi:hypothetical protein
MADAESLARELRGRGYNCPIGQTAEGKVCIIQDGPYGEFDPPVEVHFRFRGFRTTAELSGTMLAACFTAKPSKSPILRWPKP